MDLYEEIVMTHIVRDGFIFVSPQFNIKNEKGETWCCPDFVALNPSRKVVSVVEVSVADKIDALLAKINDRDNHWIQKLKDQLIREKTVDLTWTYLIQLFVRQDRKDYLERKIADLNGVSVEAIDDVCLRWLPKWWESKRVEES